MCFSSVRCPRPAREFLTSVILRPARTNNVVKWLRAWFTEHHKPAGPAVITRHEPRPAPKPAANK